MYQLTTLPNGLRVASFEMPHTHSVGVSVGVDVGSRYETPSDNGISHFLEHMAFKGTTRRNALQIAEEFDAIGGNSNAYTSMEHTVYYARVLKEDMGTALDIISDILLNSTFDPDEVEREREVILQEIAMHEDSPDEAVLDRVSAVAYPDQPVGRSILGTPETVNRFTADDMRRYVANHYGAGRMVLAAAGNIRHAELVEAAERYFSGLKPADPATPPAARYQGGEERTSKKLEQAHLVLGFPTVSHHDRLYRAAQLGATLLGGGMSSRLFQEVREKRGLAYSVYAFQSSHADGGMLTIYTGTGEKSAGDAMRVIIDEIKRFAGSLTQEELARAAKQLKAAITMAEESVGAQTEMLTRHVLTYGHYKGLAQVLSEIDAVTLADIGEVMSLALAGTPSLTALGPIKKLPSFDEIRANINS